MPSKHLPRYLIYQPNEKEFHICLEVGGKYMRWCSYYPPAMDVRYPREVNRIDDMPLKDPPKKQLFDKGTYTVNKPDSKEEAEGKVKSGIEQKSFSFILNGSKLRGRFALKKMGYRTVLQKFKDKYATEEDVLSGDLLRTISTMVPDYDESKVVLNRPQKTKTQKVHKPEAQPVEEELTADKKIGGTSYHFAFYTANGEPDICLISNAKGAAGVLKNEKDKWVLQPVAALAIVKNEKEFIAHAKALANAT